MTKDLSFFCLSLSGVFPKWPSGLATVILDLLDKVKMCHMCPWPYSLIGVVTFKRLFPKEHVSISSHPLAVST